MYKKSILKMNEIYLFSFFKNKYVQNTFGFIALFDTTLRKNDFKPGTTQTHRIDKMRTDATSDVPIRNINTSPGLITSA